jgi:hypothetical protein
MAGGSEKGRSTQGGVNISLRQAARELKKEQKEEWGTVLFTSGMLRDRYRRMKQGKPRFNGHMEGRDEWGRFAKEPVDDAAMEKPVDDTVKRVDDTGKTHSKRGGLTFTVALDLATIAISQLSRIEVDDPKREIAFERIIIWITENRYGRKGDSAW